jgi:putative holliday junction resolvase
VTRALGVDLGSRRIGLAASDPSGVLASPLRVLLRAGDVTADHAAIVAAAVEIDAATIVVGLPISLDGKRGPAARSVLVEVDALRELARPSGVEVDTYDERFSTVTAEQGLRDAKVKGSKRRARIDAAAATVILQSWLEAQR